MKAVIDTFFFLSIPIKLTFVEKIGAFTSINLNAYHNVSFERLGASRQRVETLLKVTIV